MSKEFSAGAVVFRCFDKGNVKYLLIQSKNWKNWAFPKGHLDDDETPEEAALREIEEETGLIVELLPNFSSGYEYEFDYEGKHIEKKVVFFLAEAKDENIRLSEKEHQNYSWLTYDEALHAITHEEDKKVFMEANEFLRENGKE
jgi:8-oxo-dGTP pyrophosphatase MutT (NUDIX family)